MATKEFLQQQLSNNYDHLLFAKNILSNVFGSCFSLLSEKQKVIDLTNTEEKVIGEVSIYGLISLPDESDITCYEVKLQPTVKIEQNKVSIQQFVRKLLLTKEAALINFVAPQNNELWRLTLVAKDSILTDEGIEEKTTHPQRYTYLVEKNKTNRTLAERFHQLSIENEIDFDKLKNAFSVEAMSNEFFDEYKEHYQNFVEYLTGKRLVKEKQNWVEKKTSKASPFLQSIFNGDEKLARDFVKKLMGRIVFLYFVQKKKWLGASTTDYLDGKQDFIKELFDKTGGDQRFFPNGLTELFFNALNKERPKDDWQTPTGETVKIPYLNGGLFIRDEIDKIIHKKADMLTFPARLFSHVDNQDIPDERGFLDFLNAYNFTIYEDSQNDHTVAVDPEMLGHIFENLLEDNKDKGAYYTPKEIVHYMCQESLIEYIRTQLGEQYQIKDENENGDQDHIDTIRFQPKCINIDQIVSLVKDKDETQLEGEQLALIDDYLDTVKICDPAIGSGAFPMGLLQEIFSLKELIANKLDKTFHPAKVKENIIQNAIYGVDVEKGAVDIARLRFWLSLVVDEESPKALPNLDYKIVVGDSLVSKFEGQIVEIDWETKGNVAEAGELLRALKQTLKEISVKQKAFFDPENTNKEILRKEIRNLKLDALQYQVSYNKKYYADYNPYQGGFAPSSKQKKENASIDLEIKRFNNLLKRIEELKVNTDEPFEHFDWQLDFPEILNPYIKDKESRGFDIVIGNPPYIKEYTSKKAFDGFRDSKYYQGKMDLWYGFACISIDLLKENGVECFIAQNNWITSSGASIFRNKVLKETKIKLFTDFWNYKVFKSAGIQTMIYLLKKEVPIDDYTVKYSLLQNDNIKESQLIDFLDFSNTFDIDEKYEINFDSHRYIDSSITFDNPILVKVLDEIESKNNFKLLDEEVIQGIVGAPDKAFILTDKEITKYTNEELKFIKPYFTNSTGIKSDNIIYLSDKNFSNESLENYINLYEHFIPYKEDLIKAKIKYKTPNKKYYYLHRERDESFFVEGSKIICQVRCHHPSFLYTEEEYYASRALNVIKTDRINLKYLTLFYNSKLNFFYFKNRGSVQGNMLKFDKGPLLKIPIIKPDNIDVFVWLFEIVNYLYADKTKIATSVKNEIIAKHFKEIIDGMVYELYFAELLKKHKLEIIAHLGELPEIEEDMSDGEKLATCKAVYERLHTKEHPLRQNLEKLQEVPEIALIEKEVGKKSK
jgi:hypothetical protein